MSGAQWSRKHRAFAQRAQGDSEGRACEKFNVGARIISISCYGSFQVLYAILIIQGIWDHNIGNCLGVYYVTKS